MHVVHGSLDFYRTVLLAIQSCEVHHYTRRYMKDFVIVTLFGVENHDWSNVILVRRCRI